MPKTQLFSRGRMFVFVSALAAAAALGAFVLAELGYTTQVSPALVARMERQFGSAAKDRLSRWIEFAREQKATGFSTRLLATTGGETNALQVVNSLLNRIRFVDDRAHWNQEDYWATPAESIATDGGDCEDFAIAKYYLLKELGVPIARLRITYVRALKLNQAHMVLAYYASPDAEPLILDNIEPRVQRASERKDLEPVYSFNDDEVQIVQGARRGHPSQIRAWLSLQERLLAQARI